MVLITTVCVCQCMRVYLCVCDTQGGERERLLKPTLLCFCCFNNASFQNQCVIYADDNQNYSLKLPVNSNYLIYDKFLRNVNNSIYRLAE